MADAQTLGKYELLARLGRGRNCEVFLAVRQGSERRRIVALKRLRNRTDVDAEANAALLREAELAAMIKHAKVVDVYEYGEEEGIPYIAMEYLAGQPLGALIRKAGALPQACVARIGADVADGLHAAHRLRGDDGQHLNLVHLDVSPSNIQVTYDGRVLLVDFGLARAVGTEPTTRGKIGYLAPEQVDGQGDEPDARTDIFALGIVLWEAATGKRLFRGESRAETLASIRQADAPRASTVRDDIDPSLDEIIAKALARSRDDRYASGSELAKALRVYLADSETADTTAAISELVLEHFSSERETSDEAVSNALKVLRGEKSGPQLARALSEPPEAVADLHASAEGDSEYYYYDEDDAPKATEAAPSTDGDAPADDDGQDDSEDKDKAVASTSLADTLPAPSSVKGDVKGDDLDNLDDLDDDEIVGGAGRRTMWIIAAAALFIVGIGTVVALSGGDNDKDKSKRAESPATKQAASKATDVAPAKVETVASEAKSDVPGEQTADVAAAEEAATKAAEEAAAAKAAELAAAEAADKAAEEAAAAKAAEEDAAAKAAEEAKAKAGEEAKAKAAEEAKAKAAMATDNPKKDKGKARRAYKAASRLLITGDANGAIRKYRQALEAWPGYSPAYRGLGLANERRGKSKAAIRYYKRYLRASPRAKDADSIRKRIERLGG